MSVQGLSGWTNQKKTYQGNCWVRGKPPPKKRKNSKTVPCEKTVPCHLRPPGGNLVLGLRIAFVRCQLRRPSAGGGSGVSGNANGWMCCRRCPGVRETHKFACENRPQRSRKETSIEKMYAFSGANLLFSGRAIGMEQGWWIFFGGGWYLFCVCRVGWLFFLPNHNNFEFKRLQPFWGMK